MDLQQLIKKNKKIYSLLIEYIEDGEENFNLDSYEELNLQLNNIQKRKKHEELESLLHLIANISDNHYRNPQIDKRIEQILTFFIDEIKQTMTNISIYEIFQNNKRILLFLFQNYVLYIDNHILNSFQFGHDDYFYFFYPECHFFITDEKKEEIINFFSLENEENFDQIIEKRSICENDSYISSLIREDSIDKFIVHVNQTNLSLSNAKIQHSNFETNKFLDKNNVSLIEYAAFFGSISIFKYLKMNNVELTPSLWLYAIHSKNAELINILEESSLEFPVNNSVDVCLNEAIKCHHNDIVEYFENLMNDEKKIIKYAIDSYNYLYFPDDLDVSSYFNELYNHNYFEIIDLYLKNKEIDLKSENDENQILFNAANENKYEIVYYLLSKREKIDDNLFKNCTNMKIIYIPPSIKTIGKFAFGYCSSLSQITIPFSVQKIDNYAFYCCSSLISITLSPFIESIPKYCFNECISLSQIHIPSMVSIFCENSFENCTLLNDFYISTYSNLTTIEKNAFKNCQNIELSIPFSVKNIGENAFHGCENIIIHIDDFCVEKIMDGTFFNCFSLNQILLPLNLKEIGSYSFYSCNSLSKIDIPSSVTKIERSCFSNCTSLSEVTLSNSIDVIPCEAFKGCIKLGTIYIPSSVKSIENSAFMNCEILRYVNIPSSVTFIGKRAFAGCKLLDDLQIPDLVSFIGDGCFDECISLRKISIPSSLTEIKSYTFHSCGKLADIKIKQNIKFIGEKAFENCLSLKKIRVPYSVTKIGKKAFNMCISLSLAMIPSALNIDNIGIKKSVRIIRT